MRPIIRLLAAAVAAAATIQSCSTLTGYPTDAEASYAKAIELTKKSVDTDKFKIYSLSIMEGETLSDNLFLVTVKLVNKDDQAFSQSYYMNGLEPTDLRDVQSTFEAPEYETTVGIDLSELDPARIAAQIAQAKTMLPEGHSYKSVGRYEIEEEVPPAIPHSTATANRANSTPRSSSASPRTARKRRAARAKPRTYITKPK